jgi:hypothetical protein
MSLKELKWMYVSLRSDCTEHLFAKQLCLAELLAASTKRLDDLLHLLLCSKGWLEVCVVNKQHLLTRHLVAGGRNVVTRSRGGAVGEQRLFDRTNQLDVFLGYWVRMPVVLVWPLLACSTRDGRRRRR